MSRKIVLVGSGPTAAYTLKYLIGSDTGLDIRVLEAGDRIDAVGAAGEAIDAARLQLEPFDSWRAPEARAAEP